MVISDRKKKRRACVERIQESEKGREEYTQSRPRSNADARHPGVCPRSPSDYQSSEFSFHSLLTEYGVVRM